MSSFEEEFPSLKNTGINLGLSDVEQATKELVVKYCLDKQRVKDVIKEYVKLEELQEGMVVTDEHMYRAGQMAKTLLKELGLGDEE